MFADAVRYRCARAVVLGATGFIGRWVARELAAYGADLLLPVRDTAALECIAAEYGFTGRMMSADLRDPSAAKQLIAGFRPAVVFNLAGYGVDRSERDERESLALNVQLVEAVLEAVCAHRDTSWSGQAFVQAGSALEYGLNGGRLAEDAPTVPHTQYGRHKLAAAETVAAFASRHRLPALVARLFTVYGPGEHAGRLLPTLLDAARGATVSLSPGLQKRDFTFIADVAEGLCRLALAECRPGEIVNLATGRLTTVRDFVGIATDILEIPAERLAFGALETRPDEFPHHSVSIERLRRLTGWTPPHSIGDGVRNTARFLSTREIKEAAAVGGKMS